MATATALTAVPAPVASVSEALAAQLIEARTKIDRLIDAFDATSAKALTDAQRTLADQAAQALARADKPDVGAVPQLAERAMAVASLAEQNKRNAEHLDNVRKMIGKRFDELKQSAPDRALLLKLLKNQRDKIDAEIRSRSGETDKLQEQLGQLDEEITTLEGGRAAAASASAKRAGKR